MGSIGKSFALILILILIIPILSLSLSFVKPAFAQTAATPSTPEFTIKLGVASNDVPSTYSLNSSSGQTIAQPGYHEEYTTIELVIKNQPLVFTNYPGWNGVGFFYNVRTTTTPDTGSWNELYNAQDGYLIPANSSYTTVSIPFKGNDMIDIQVEAMIGQIVKLQVSDPNTPSHWRDAGTSLFEGQFSGWSANQTATISDTITYLESSPTATPALPSANTATSSSTLFLIIAITIIVIAFLLGIIISLVIYFRKRIVTK